MDFDIQEKIFDAISQVQEFHKNRKLKIQDELSRSFVKK